jgi:hypothetical protein
MYINGMIVEPWWKMRAYLPGRWAKCSYLGHKCHWEQCTAIHGDFDPFRKRSHTIKYIKLESGFIFHILSAAGTVNIMLSSFLINAFWTGAMSALNEVEDYDVFIDNIYSGRVFFRQIGKCTLTVNLNFLAQPIPSFLGGWEAVFTAAFCQCAVF